MHQGWPKFVQNLWYATADNGLAALVYGASEVKAVVAGGQEVSFVEETNYPFEDKIKFTYQSKNKARFALHLRIPAWCKKPVVKVNGQVMAISMDKIVAIVREWSANDVVELELPMTIQFSRWYEKSLGIERGPLVYALKIGESWREVKTPEFEDTFYEVTPTTAWKLWGFGQTHPRGFHTTQVPR